MFCSKFTLYLHSRDEARLTLSRKSVVHSHKGFYNTVNVRRITSSFPVVMKQARQRI